MTNDKFTYSDGILEGFRYLLKNHSDVFLMGQGLWSPWYVGNTMKDLDKEFGTDRVMDTPVSEDASTAIAAGASLCGQRAVIVHPRVDFMILATNAIVNQVAKWNHMLGGGNPVPVTIRAIINRGGEQGAQHSQALHSWFAHIPGLRVVTPATAKDARDLLIASVLCDDPVLYLDDRWCYEATSEYHTPEVLDLTQVGPSVLSPGDQITLVGNGYSTQLALLTAEKLKQDGISAEVVDLRVLNPFHPEIIAASVEKTGRLAVIDGSWKTCGMAGEVIAAVTERVQPSSLKSRPLRITLPDAPAPTSSALEKNYYPSVDFIFERTKALVQGR